MYATEHTQYARFDLVVIGASLGGIATLRTILLDLPADFPAPIVIVQHLAARWPSRLPETLARGCPISVTWVRDGHPLDHPHVFVAPPGQHTRVERDGTLSLSRGTRVNFVRPSADVLFGSAAEYAGARTLAVVLTGCGRDGAAGVAAVQRVGGWVLVQDARTSRAFGMPAAAITGRSADFALPLDMMAPALVSLVMVPGAAELLQVHSDRLDQPPPGVRARDWDACRDIHRRTVPLTGSDGRYHTTRAGWFR